MKRMVCLVLGTFILTLGLGSANAAPSHHNNSRIKHHSIHAHKSRKVKTPGYTGIVNLNTADENQLTSLKSIGPKKAKAIIVYRKKSGPFHSVNDLQGVKGVSAKFIQRLLKKNPRRVVVKKR